VGKATRRNTERLSAALKRLRIEVYGYGLTGEAHVPSSAAYRRVKTTENKQYNL
jgi:hypothetical protein